MAELPDSAIDSELVVLDATGNAMWERVRRRAVMRLGNTVMAAAAEEPAVLCAADLLALGSDDLRTSILARTKGLLVSGLTDELGQEGIAPNVSIRSTTQGGDRRGVR